MELLFLLIGLLPLALLPEYGGDPEDQDEKDDGREDGQDRSDVLQPNITDDDMLFEPGYTGPTVDPSDIDDDALNAPEYGGPALKPVDMDDTLVTLGAGFAPIVDLEPPHAFEADESDAEDDEQPTILHAFDPVRDTIVIELEPGEEAKDQEVMARASENGEDGDVFINNELFAVMVGVPDISASNVVFKMAGT